MKLSVIITAYNRNKITVAHVRECMNSTVMPDEIIVVNDGGTPDLKEMLQKLEKKTKIIYARINEDIPWNYVGACNLGAWISRGEFLMFEDNDNIPTPTWYEQALKMFEENPEVGRIIGVKRLHVNSSDLHKPASEWEITGSRGPNQGTSMMKRDIYIFLKGKDEKFAGNYGWMYYDWKNRLLSKAKTKFGAVGQFYYVVDGQCELSRNMAPRNFRVYRRNAVDEVTQSSIGILNFTYTMETL